MSHVPPHDLGAEQAVLGAMMLSRQAAADGVQKLREHDFYRPAHASIFAAITAAWSQREPCDAIAVAARLDEAGELARIGGAPYLHTLVESVPVAANLGYYARIVATRAHSRRLLEYGTRVAQMALEPGVDPGEVAAHAAKLLADSGESRETTGLIPLADILNPALSKIEAASKQGKFPGLATGLGILDDATGGLRGGQLVIVAGRPGMGKSVLGVDLARYASTKLRKQVAMFSLEMGRDEIVNRMLAAELNINLADITKGDLDDRQWAAISRKVGEIESSPLYIDDSAPLTMPQIVARSRRLHARTPLSLIVVDYLQLLETGRRSESRQLDVSEISRGLKLLAKELDVPVVAAAQLNRGVEQRQDKRPNLSDLRESGALENDADVVIMLYRPAYYEPKTDRGCEIDLNLAKNRHGPQGTITAHAEFEYARIVDRLEEHR